MRSGRGILAVVIVGLAAVTLSPSVVSAADGVFQAIPATDWAVPGPEPLDGVGQWVYVAPIPAGGPGQLPATGYVYGPSFSPFGGGFGLVGLSTDDQGPLAGIRLSGPDIGASPLVGTIRYAWSPGKFYFLLAYHHGNGLWGGWVYDYAAAAWTLIGTVQAPAGWGLLKPAGSTFVDGAEGAPMAPFSIAGIPAAEVPCSGFPRVDAYSYPPVGWRGSTYSLATLTDKGTTLGTCPTAATMEHGWVHHQLGTPAA